MFLDITASSDGRATMIDMVSPHRRAGVHPVHRRRRHPLASTTPARMLRAGADKVSVNTAAVQRPELIAEIATEFGAQCVVCAIDAKRRADGSGFEVYLHGGRTPTGIDAVAWAEQAVALGAGEILLTSMDRDGTQGGLRPRAHPRGRRRRRRAGDRQRRRRHARSTSSRASSTGTPTGVLAASIFHFGEHTIAEAKAAMPRPASPSARPRGPTDVDDRLRLDRGASSRSRSSTAACRPRSRRSASRPAGALWTAQLVVDRPDVDRRGASQLRRRGCRRGHLVQRTRRATTGFVARRRSTRPRLARLLASTTELARRSGRRGAWPRRSARSARCSATAASTTAGTPPAWDEVRAFHRRRIAVLADTGPDLVRDRDHARRAPRRRSCIDELAARTALPAWVIVHVRRRRIDAAAATRSSVAAAGVAAVPERGRRSASTAPAPRHVAGAAARASPRHVDLPLVAYPNHGARVGCGAASAGSGDGSDHLTEHVARVGACRRSVRSAGAAASGRTACAP